AGALLATKPSVPPLAAPPPEPPARPVTVLPGTAPVATDSEVDAPVSSMEADPGLEASGSATRAALDAALELARAGREPEAGGRLDEALASPTSVVERAALEATRQGILDEVSRRMDQDFAAAERAARSGDTAAVRSIVDALYPHVPAALAEKRRAAYEKL